MPIDGETFKRLGRVTAGAVSVISAYDRAGDAIVALTVSSFVTLSYEPPLAMFAIQHSADSYPSMVGSKAFGVSLLAADQADIARQFARKGPDKIANASFADDTAIIERSIGDFIRALARELPCDIGLICRQQADSERLAPDHRWVAVGAMLDGKHGKGRLVRERHEGRHCQCNDGIPRTIVRGDHGHRTSGHSTQALERLAVNWHFSFPPKLSRIRAPRRMPASVA